jgi:hypothetical protein
MGEKWRGQIGGFRETCDGRASPKPVFWKRAARVEGRHTPGSFRKSGKERTYRVEERKSGKERT